MMMRLIVIAAVVLEEPTHTGTHECSAMHSAKHPERFCCAARALELCDCVTWFARAEILSGMIHVAHAVVIIGNGSCSHCKILCGCACAAVVLICCCAVVLPAVLLLC